MGTGSKQSITRRHTDETGHDAADSGGDAEQMSDSIGIEKLVL